MAKKLCKLLWKRAVQTDLFLFLMFVANCNSDFPSIYLFTLLFFGPSSFQFLSTFGHLNCNRKIKGTRVGYRTGGGPSSKAKKFLPAAPLLAKAHHPSWGPGNRNCSSLFLPSLIAMSHVPCFVCHDTDSVSLPQYPHPLETGHC